ncbi:MAG: SPFH/Band 7/PHB domain protein [Ardenticatenales bacterium]|nr:SPFH/Band 7/PHB domain protein [Ardenticatenales bacterium]
MSPFVVLLFVIAIFVFIVALMGVRIVSPYQKGVIQRLGRYQKTAAPGLTIIVPFIDSIQRVDMREQVVDVLPQEVITKDNVVVTVDAIVYFEATDPVKLVYNVADFYSAATKLAQTNLRNVVGEMELDEALTSRDRINAKLREVLDDATDKWGVRIVRVEIKRIDPPADVTQAMHRQMKAEREKRAQILESEGLRQAQILKAEGEAESRKLVADGERYKLEAEAAGRANAITIVYGAISAAQPDEKLIAIQYLEALKAMADGRATKVFIPYEASGVLGALGGIRELFAGEGDGPRSDAPASPSRPAAPTAAPSAGATPTPVATPTR